ncbi:Uncharacterised protein [Mycobacteroides abscessus]|nr:Uncharacterised protein [Mycobacteroides abscessus]
MGANGYTLSTTPSTTNGTTSAPTTRSVTWRFHAR